MQLCAGLSTPQAELRKSLIASRLKFNLTCICPCSAEFTAERNGDLLSALSCAVLPIQEPVKIIVCCTKRNGFRKKSSSSSDKGSMLLLLKKKYRNYIGFDFRRCRDPEYTTVVDFQYNWFKKIHHTLFVQVFLSNN